MSKEFLEQLKIAFAVLMSSSIVSSFVTFVGGGQSSQNPGNSCQAFLGTFEGGMCLAVLPPVFASGVFDIVSGTVLQWPRRVQLRSRTPVKPSGHACVAGKPA